MSWIDDAVDAFGRGMGLPQLALPEGSTVGNRSRTSAKASMVTSTR